MMEALGIIETKGLVAMITAADAMLKSANVKLVGYIKTGEAIVTVSVRGSVADCRAAVDAGAHAAGEVGTILSAHVIAYPHQDLEDRLPISLEEKV